jgi:hypothetical protein
MYCKQAVKVKVMFSLCIIKHPTSRELRWQELEEEEVGVR